jgi:hypothetical protein
LILWNSYDFELSGLGQSIKRMHVDNKNSKKLKNKNNKNV